MIAPTTLRRRTAAMPIALMLGMAGIVAPFARADGPAVPGRLSVTGLQGRLFHEATGKFSEDVLNDPNVVLWNVPIRSPAAGGPSSSVLVLVEFSGSGERADPRRRVELRVRYRSSETSADGKKPVGNTELVELLAPGRLGDDGHGFAAFVIHGTGCAPVHLAARVVGDVAKPVERTIEFKCGE